MFEGKLFFAPLKNPQMIADMGTGTGSLYGTPFFPMENIDTLQESGL